MSTSLTLDRLSSSSGSQNAHSSTEVPEIEQSTVRVSKAGGSVLQPQVLFRRWWCARRARAWWRRCHRDQAKTKPGGIGDVHTRVTSSRRTSGTVSGSRPSWLVRRPRPPCAVAGGLGAGADQEGVGQQREGDVPAPRAADAATLPRRRRRAAARTHHDLLILASVLALGLAEDQER